MPITKLYQQIDAHVAKNSAITTVSGQQITYGELSTLSKRIASGLQADGFKQGDKLFLLAETTPHVLACIIAVLRLGGIVVAADTGTGKDVLQARLQDSGASWLLLSTKLQLLRYHPLLLSVVRKKRPEMPYVFGVTMPKNIILDATKKSLTRHKTLYSYAKHSVTPLAATNAQQCLLVYTSGTTGKPKAVAHTHETLLASVHIIQLLITHKNPVLYTHQPYFVLLGILLGVHVVTDPRTFTAERFIKNSLKYSPTITFGPPGEFIPLLQYMKTTGSVLPKSYKQIMFGSAPITKSFLQRCQPFLANADVTCMYGMTEAIPIATISMQQKLAWKGTGDVLGKPVSGIDYKFVQGELFVRGKHVITTYVGQKPSEWIASGDIIKEQNGLFVLQARKKDMILKKSCNIYPGLYEPTIELMPEVTACAMVGVYNQQKEDEDIILCIETVPKAQLDAPSVMKRLTSGRYSIDSAALPDKIVFMKLPRSGRQLKINKQRIKELVNI